MPLSTTTHIWPGAAIFKRFGLWEVELQLVRELCTSQRAPAVDLLLNEVAGSTQAALAAQAVSQCVAGSITVMYPPRFPSWKGV